jgi:hypothetical protein
MCPKIRCDEKSCKFFESLRGSEHCRYFSIASAVDARASWTYQYHYVRAVPPFVRQSRFFRALVSPSLCCAKLTTINNKITISSFPEDNDELITIC